MLFLLPNQQCHSEQWRESCCRYSKLFIAVNSDAAMYMSLFVDVRFPACKHQVHVRHWAVEEDSAPKPCTSPRGLHHEGFRWQLYVILFLFCSATWFDNGSSSSFICRQKQHIICKKRFWNSSIQFFSEPAVPKVFVGRPRRCWSWKNGSVRSWVCVVVWLLCACVCVRTCMHVCVCVCVWLYVMILQEITTICSWIVPQLCDECTSTLSIDIRPVSIHCCGHSVVSWHVMTLI